MILTLNQLHILQHSLGCDQYGQSTYSGRDENDGCGIYARNRYVSDPDIDLSILVECDLLEDRGAIKVYGDMHYYVVTKEGIAVMKAQSPRPPKLTKSQSRYREFCDADCGLKFSEWLKTKRT